MELSGRMLQRLWACRGCPGTQVPERKGSRAEGRVYICVPLRYVLCGVPTASERRTEYVYVR